MDAIVESQSNPINLDGVLSTDISTGFDLPTDIESLEKIVEAFQSNPKFKGFGNNIRPVDDTTLAAILAAPLLIGVMAIKFREEELLSKSPSPNYEQTMIAIDEELYLLHRCNLLLKTLMPSLKATIEKVIRMDGSKRGGRGKKNKFENLKKAVLSECDAFHAKKTASQAGLVIYERIRNDAELKEDLSDEELKPLSKNPALLFAKWIRRHRDASLSSK